MVTRSLFELALDIRLIDVIPNAVAKITHFTLHEKLRQSEALLRYEGKHPLSDRVSSDVRRAFVATRKDEIQRISTTLWTPHELSRLPHWSGLNLPDRVGRLNDQFGETYHVFYGPLSWNSHAGLTGVIERITRDVCLHVRPVL